MKSLGTTCFTDENQVLLGIARMYGNILYIDHNFSIININKVINSLYCMRSLLGEPCTQIHMSLFAAEYLLQLILLRCHHLVTCAACLCTHFKYLYSIDGLTGHLVINFSMRSSHKFIYSYTFIVNITMHIFTFMCVYSSVCVCSL